MSRVNGNIDSDKPVDVPTMMKMLMVVYNNVRDDEILDEVAEAVSDAICILGDIRKVAQQVILEEAPASSLSRFDSIPNEHKLC